MPGAELVPGARLNYAEHLVGLEEDRDRVAVVARSQTRPTARADLRRAASSRPAACRAGLQRLGVRPGDRVVAYLPNIPETLIAFIATASLGAIWATCAPEFGARSVVDRFAQIEPTRAARGRRLRLSRPLHRPARRGRAIRAAGCRRSSTSCGVPYRRGAQSPDRSCWEDLTRGDARRSSSIRSPFDHPLYVLFSSGTTGLPKAIVHGHGGQLVEHRKNQGLGLGPQARRAPAVVLDDGLDDVERARLGAAAALVDRDARRRPRVARPAASSGGSPRSSGRR